MRKHSQSTLTHNLQPFFPRFELRLHFFTHFRPLYYTFFGPNQKLLRFQTGSDGHLRRLLTRSVRVASDEKARHESKSYNFASTTFSSVCTNLGEVFE